MKLLAPLAIFALLAPAASSTSLPACSTNSITPCSCPNGTSYAQSVTFAVIGAAAADVKALISDCAYPLWPPVLLHGNTVAWTLTHTIIVYKCAWLGVLPFATQGPDNEPGVSIRTSNLPTLVGLYVITERASISFKSLSTHIPSEPYNLALINGKDIDCLPYLINS